MNPLTNLARNRHRTAISRTDYSRPISSALADGLIGHTDATVFDYGCGLGDDVRHLKRRGINSWGWDPTHRSDGKCASAQVVNLGYVVNVIEDVEERKKCLAHAWSYAKKALIVSARLASQTRDFTPVSRYGDGYVTSIETFQKLYEQGELKAWLEAQLGESAVAAGPASSTCSVTPPIDWDSWPADTRDVRELVCRWANPGLTNTGSCFAPSLNSSRSTPARLWTTNWTTQS